MLLYLFPSAEVNFHKSILIVCMQMHSSTLSLIYKRWEKWRIQVCNVNKSTTYIVHNRPCLLITKKTNIYQSRFLHQWRHTHFFLSLNFVKRTEIKFVPKWWCTGAVSQGFLSSFFLSAQRSVMYVDSTPAPLWIFCHVQLFSGRKKMCQSPPPPPPKRLFQGCRCSIKAFPTPNHTLWHHPCWCMIFFFFFFFFGGGGGGSSDLMQWHVNH